MKKLCVLCKVEKDKKFFYKSKRNKDGLDGRCKECRARRIRDIYNSSEEFRKKEAARGVERRKHQKYWDSLKMYNHENPVKYKARTKLANAVKDGKIQRLPCEKCGNVKTHAHHHNGYDGENWKVVTWLCSKHHMEEHRKYK